MKTTEYTMQHSVTLVKEKCKGCTICIKQCPTEAIRVRNGRAIIIDERCVDCGRCIRICPHYAKKAVYDSMSRLNDYKYSIALPAPSIYGQFNNLDDINQIPTGLLALGFDYVFDVSIGAEMVSNFMKLTVNNLPFETPVISSACPAITRLICMRFPKLIDNIAQYIAPMEIAAICARDEAVARTGFLPEQIGIFFITPCPAKVTAIHSPSHLHHPVIDGAFSMADIYKKLLLSMKRDKQTTPVPVRATGIGWALSGGGLDSISTENSIAVDGIKQVITILEDVEDGKLSDIQFLELSACNQGCVGGCLTVENPYVAKARIKNLINQIQKTEEKLSIPSPPQDRFLSDKLLVGSPVWKLAKNRMVAMERYQKIVDLKELLPGLDCGSCGTPGCRALAEDVVLGYASEDDCIFRVRERMQEIAETGDADDYLPPPFRKDTGGD